jgi:M6 family metalloprotease-like protein
MIKDGSLRPGRLPPRSVLSLCIVLLAVVAANMSVSGQSGSVTGRLALVWGDSFGARPESRSLAYLFSDGSAPTRLVFPPGQQPENLLQLNGQLVTASGIRQSSNPGVAAPAQDVMIVQQLDWVRPLAPGTAPEPAITIGPQPWVTVLCRFSDSSTVTRNINTSFLTGTSYPSLDEYWRETSFNNVNLAGSAVNVWVNLPQPRSYYIYDQTGDGVEDADLARLVTDCTAASDATVDFSRYVGINMIFNQSIGPFAWGGGWNLMLDGVSKVWHTTWIGVTADDTFLAELTHETGHGFGLPHSSGPYGVVYDSNWDVMSNPYIAYDFIYSDYIPQGTIAYHKDLEGWVPSARRYVASQGTSATITIERLAQPLATDTYLMAQIPINGATDHFYTVETRALVGHDRWIPGAGVVVHDVVPARSEPAHVVDPDNNGNPNDAAALWTTGETFVDAANGITVSVLSSNDTSATVFITNATAGAAPSVSTGAASDVTQIGATLHAAVNPNGSSTRVFFEIGETTNYGTTTAFQTIGAGTSIVSLAVPVTALACGTLYHYRAVGVNSSGTTNGGDATFTTLSCTGLPDAVTGPARSVFGRGAILTGTVSPHGSDTWAYFEYGLTANYGGQTVPVWLGNSGASLPVSGGGLVGLRCGTQYYYRVVAASAGGTAIGSPGTFTTLSAPCVRGRSDIDGDGASDLTVWRPSDGTWRSLLSTTSFDPASAHAVPWGGGSEGDVPLSGDVDGDGIQDPIVWRSQTGTWYWLTSSSGFDVRSFGSSNWGHSGDVPLLGDIDGDGKSDLIIWRPATGWWFWLLSSNGYDPAAYGTIEWGNQASGDVPLVGDIDGDGKADPTIWRESTGEWYWLLSSRGYAAFDSKQWGIGALGDQPLLGDIDGDGKTDLIIWRASTGTWYYLLSSSGFDSGVYGVREWGTRTLHDVPLTADLDGDGKAELVIWRPVSGAWYWLTSTTGYDLNGYGATAWGAAGDVAVLK